MAKVFAQSVRDALLLIDPGGKTKASKLPNMAKRTILRNDLADLDLDHEDGPFIVLTKVGLAFQEALEELRDVYATCDRMREQMTNGVFSGLPRAVIADTLQSISRGQTPRPISNAPARPINDDWIRTRARGTPRLDMERGIVVDDPE